MFRKIVIFIIIIFLFTYNIVFAECDFKQYQYIDELKTIKSIKSIEIDINKKRRFYKNFARIIVSKSQNIPTELKKNFKGKIKVNYLR